MPGLRDITLRSASYDASTRDSFTGQRVPTFTESTIQGTLNERTGDMPFFSEGRIMVQNAVLFTQDTTVNKLDQIKDGSNYYKVLEISEQHDQDGNLVYRACHLQRIELAIAAAIVQKTLTVSEDLDNPTWGSTSPAAGAHDYDEGVNVQVLATGAEGYELDYWVIDDVESGSDNPVVITMDADHSIRPVWQEIPT